VRRGEESGEGEKREGGGLGDGVEGDGKELGTSPDRRRRRRCTGERARPSPLLVTRPVVAKAVETEEGTAGGVGEEGGGGVGVLDVEGGVDECGTDAAW
jgi:hypothetical protein